MLAVWPLGPQYSLLFAWHELGSGPIWGVDTLHSQSVFLFKTSTLHLPMLTPSLTCLVRHSLKLPVTFALKLASSLLYLIVWCLFIKDSIIVNNYKYFSFIISESFKSNLQLLYCHVDPCLLSKPYEEWNIFEKTFSSNLCSWIFKLLYEQNIYY